MPPSTRKTPKKTTARSRAQLDRVANSGDVAEAHPVPTSQYGQGWRTGSETDIQRVTLPSGAVCLARSPGTTGLIEAGVLDKLDPLTTKVDRELVQPAKGRTPKSIADSDISDEELIQMIEIADKVMVHVVVGPRVLLAPVPRCKVCAWEDNKTSGHEPKDKHEFVPTPREANAYYTDGIDIHDKFEILQFAMGGARALESFRNKR